MTDEYASLPYRPCAGLMLVNGDGHVFVGKRIDNKEGDAWQMPQGGIDDGEDFLAAAMRELWEETGVSEGLVSVLAESREEYFYDLPEDLLGKLWGGKYRGQRQKWVLLRFSGNDNDVRLDAHNPPEFCDYKWVVPDDLPDLIVPFKRRVYRQVVEEFRTLI
ncbi:RNA pyrophosphohydrolase [Novosphingobium sp. ZN18A2]|uniref:RNA pyrophosphohydrolase n=1 Tax=Novosphingobium sp. ZN18A2 TaxID=3079861 RepID=UPI0030D5186B